MGKKLKKKAARSSHKEKRGSISSPKAVNRQGIPDAKTPNDGVVVVKERTPCPHIDKGVDLEKLSAKLSSSEPLRCEDCREDVADRRKGKGKHGKKRGNAESKAIWVCLDCGHFSCGGPGLPTTPQSHAVRHMRQYRHPLAIQFENPQLRWCFPCNTLIPVEKSGEDGAKRDVLDDIVKAIKGRSSEGSTENVEDVWFGSGSVTSAMKSDYSLSSASDGKDGYSVRGLVNLGNTCFFNSVMQNLLAMVRVRDYFINLDDSVGPLTSALKKLYAETSPEAGLKNVINPRSCFGCVCTKAPQFRGYQQHDSHELLRCLLDGLCTEELAMRKQRNSSEKDGKSPNMQPTFVDAIFGGQLSSSVTCLECGHSSIVHEPFLDLSLPVPTKKPPSKKVQAVSRAKKPKLPPKRTAKNRPRVELDAKSQPSESVSDQSTGRTSCEIRSAMPDHDDSALLDSIGVTTLAEDMGFTSADLRSIQGSDNKQSANDVNAKVISTDCLTWLDYIDMDTVSNGDDIDLLFDDLSVNKESGTATFEPNDLVQSTLESSGQISLAQTESAPYLDTFTVLDYCRRDDHDINSRVHIKSETQGSVSLDAVQSDAMSEAGEEAHDKSIQQDPMSKDVIQNDTMPEDSSEILDQSALLGSVPKDARQGDVNPENDSGSCSQVCPKESDSRVNSSGNYSEDETPLQVQTSEVILLPYGDDTSLTGETWKEDGEFSSSAAAGGVQDSVDFDGFGDLFNEPEAVVGPCINPMLVGNTSEANEVSGFAAKNSSESEPDEVDNSDAPVSIESCLAYFTKPELLSKDEHAWLCENCSKILREEKMRSRMKLQKLNLDIAGYGGNGRNSSDFLSSAENDTSPAGAENLSNGYMENNHAGATESAVHATVADNGKINGCKSLLKIDQQVLLNPVASVLEDADIGMESACLKQSNSSKQPSVSSGDIDTCTISEPGDARQNNVDRSRKSCNSSEKFKHEGSKDEEINSNCVKVKRDATKRILVNKAPPILTIHLKRFSQDARGRLSKLQGHVQFRDTIDLKPYLDSRCSERDMYKYRLIGVVEHSGSMRGGHYVAYVRGGTRSQGNCEGDHGDCVWYYASDAYVREASLEDVLRCEAYILFYEAI